MLNKDKRSLILSFALGDGCLHYIKNSSGVYGGLTIDHGMDQADYQSWKSSMLSTITGRKVNMRSGHNGKSVQVSFCMKRMRAWRKFCYPRNKKSLGKILKFIRHPEFALAVWLMDDGYVESSITKNKNYSAALRIFCCDSDENDFNEIKEWFLKSFGIETKVRLTKKRNVYYPFLKIGCADSLRVWEKIRPMVLQFRSMRYKFRYLEQIFQLRCSQRLPSEKLDDIVRST